MKSLPKINTLLYSLLLLLIAQPLFMMAFQGTAEAAYKSETIKREIEIKCTIALAKYKGSKTTEEFKDFKNACKMTGGYAPNGNKRAERAKRLMVVCGHRKFLLPVNAQYDVPLYDVYNKGGDILGGDCDKILASSELNNLAKKAYGNNSVTIKDPAFECAEDPDSCDLVRKYIDPLIYFLGAFVGIAATIGIISGGLRYVSAGDDPQKTAAGQKQIKSAIVAVIAYIVLLAAYRWIVPPV